MDGAWDVGISLGMARAVAAVPDLCSQKSPISVLKSLSDSKVGPASPGMESAHFHPQKSGITHPAQHGYPLPPAQGSSFIPSLEV